MTICGSVAIFDNKNFDGSVDFDHDICIVSGLTGVIVLWLGDLDSCDCGFVKVQQLQPPIVSKLCRIVVFTHTNPFSPTLTHYR